MNRSSLLLLLACLAFGLLASCSKDDVSGDSTGGGTGQVGSMARFAIARGHLYVVNDDNLSVYQLNGEGRMTFLAARRMNWGRMAETLFPYGDYLFVGTTTGMLIYSLDDPVNLTQVSEYRHIWACDPVVVQGNYAFVTLRNGQQCQRAVNRLEVVDISQITAPRQVATLDLANPHGLAVNGRNLVICEGGHGLKSLAIDNPTLPKVQHSLDAGHCYDVLAGSQSWIVTGADGIRQYRLDDLDRLHEISRMPVSLP